MARLVVWLSWLRLSVAARLLGGGRVSARRAPCALVDVAGRRLVTRQQGEGVVRACRGSPGPVVDLLLRPNRDFVARVSLSRKPAQHDNTGANAEPCRVMHTLRA
jgi:hypothetical protein